MVRDHLEPFLASVRERSESGRGLPAFVERELYAYLDCGILARGFARVRCPGCGFERLVAFSCKGSICPSCAARYPKVASRILGLFTRAIFSWLRRAARRLGAKDPRAAAVTVVQGGTSV